MNLEQRPLGQECQSHFYKPANCLELTLPHENAVAYVSSLKSILLSVKNSDKLSQLSRLAALATIDQKTLSMIDRFRRERNFLWVVIRNLTPPMYCGDTPIYGHCDGQDTRLVDIALTGISSLFGSNPVSFDFENNGELYRNIVPNPNYKGQRSSWGADKTLYWHQDNNFQPFEFLDEKWPFPPMPRHLNFYCIYNTEAAPTRLISLESVLSYLDESSISNLMEPQYCVCAPDSVLSDSGERLSGPKSALIAYGPMGERCSRIDPELIIPTTSRAKKALQSLKKALVDAEQHAHDVILKPGDFLLFDSYRVLHMRNSFRPKSGKAPRWLRRVYGKSA